jgi:tetratricopeptide (TPR) repeat protein
VFDDEIWIRDNPDIGVWSRGPGEPPARRVAYLTLKLNHRLGGLDPFGYHLFNVAVHALVALAVYALARRLLSLAAAHGEDRASVRWAALAGAALFAVHPIQTQAVTYVIQRITSLAALFYVAALALYARARAGQDATWVRGAAYWGSLACGVLGMLTKEIVLTLPIAVVVLELAFARGRPRERVLAVAPFLAILPVVPSFVVRSFGSLGAARGAATHEETLPRLDYLATQTTVVLDYLRLLVVPVNQVLDHDVPAQHGFGSPRVVLSGLLLAALLSLGVLLLVRGRSGLRVAGFGIVLFFLGLAVESSVVPIVDVMNEHRVYLASAGAALAVAALVHAAAERRQRVVRWLAAGVVLASAGLAAATVARNEVWRDGISLWRDVTLKNPLSARGHFNLGNVLMDSGDIAGATAEWRRASEIDPGLSQAWNQLGNVALVQGDLAGAESSYRRAISTPVVIPDANYNLGLVLERTGRPADALEQYRRFLETAGPERRAESDALRARLGW